LMMLMTVHGARECDNRWNHSAADLDSKDLDYSSRDQAELGDGQNRSPMSPKIRRHQKKLTQAEPRPHVNTRYIAI